MRRIKWYFEVYPGEGYAIAVAVLRHTGSEWKRFRLVPIEPRTGYVCDCCREVRAGRAWRQAPGEWAGFSSRRFSDYCVQAGGAAEPIPALRDLVGSG